MNIIFRYFSILFLILISVNPMSAQWWIQSSFGTFGYCLAISDSNLYVGTMGGEIFRSTNNGANWSKVNSGLPSSDVLSLIVTPRDTTGTNLYTGISNNGVYISTNNGTNWSAASSGLLNMTVWCFAIKDTFLFAGTSGGVYRSSNNGTSWTTTSSGMTNTTVRSFVVKDKYLFAGTYNGVFLSSDNGLSWNATSSGLTNVNVRSLAVEDTLLFAGTTGGIFVSHDNGQSWNAVNSGLTNLSVWCLLATGRNLFSGTDSPGIFLSSNNGVNWTSVNTPNLSNTSVWSMGINETYLFIGTSAGVWKRPLSEMITTAREIQNGIPSKYTLEQNYPNPFNPSTTIVFTLPSQSLVSLTIFDCLGKELSIQIMKEMPAGIYSHTLDAVGLPSGVYFYRLQAGAFTETKKLHLLR